MSDEHEESMRKFEKTVEAVYKNKINRHNAFEHRIENIGDLIPLSSDTLTDAEFWNKYSSIINTCGVIYGYCVDNAHEEVYKMLASTSRTLNTTNTENLRVNKRIHISLTNNLETSEDAINFKQTDRHEFFDPNFDKIKNNFDCSNLDTSLFNNVFINNLVDLVFLEEDKMILPNKLPNTKAEINMEGLLTFSFNELLSNNLCQRLESISNLVRPAVKNFDEVWEKVDNEVNFKLPEPDLPLNDFLSSDEESSIEVEHSFNLKENLEDRCINSFEESLRKSERVIHLKERLESNVLDRRKGKRKIKVKEIPSYNCPIIKLDEDTYNKNTLKYNDKRSVVKREYGNSFERGFRESRLGNLFSRKINFVRESSHDRTDDVWEPLSVDPNLVLENPAGLDDIQHKKSLNIKLLTSDILGIIEKSQEINFLEVIDELSSKIENQETDHLTYHMGFIALLHLANEHGLVLLKIDEVGFLIKHHNN